MIEFREIKNDAEYNPLLISKQMPLTQAWFYGQWQEMTGRKVRRFEVKKNSKIIGFFQIIRYSLPFNQSLLYIPHGPILKEMGLDNEFLKTFRDKLIDLAKEENSVFVRFDFSSPRQSFSEGGTDLNNFFKKVPAYAYHSFYFQPKFEWCVNLIKTEDELISEMHPKNRYNIRLAEKKGVKIEIVKNNFQKYFEKFYTLLKETAKHDNFKLHLKNYYQNIFETLTTDNAFLAVARYDNKILLVNLVLLYGETAYFIFGGSSDKFKNLMFSHLAQWETIKEAKKRGMTVYNLGGVQGNDGSYKNYKGVSVFKKRFDGEIFEHSNSYDIVSKPFWYYLYNLRKWLLNQK